MLTGDAEATALAVARSVGGIDEVRAGLRPEDKARIVGELQLAGARVAMAGDGINDAPAIAAANVGIAMGTGTDVAIESAGMTLTKGDLSAIVRARRLARATMGNIRQNLFFSFLFNGIGVPVAAGVLYPVAGILLSPDDRRCGDGAVIVHRCCERATARCGDALKRSARARSREDRHTVARTKATAAARQPTASS